MDQTPLSLEAVRARIDQIDGDLLRLIDERSSLARAVAAAKAAAGDSGKLGLRAAREAQLLRKLLKAPHPSASAVLIVRIWRELIGDSLFHQGPYHVSAWGGRDPARVRELARLRFGISPPLTLVAKPAEALAAARILGGVGVFSLEPDDNWWGRLLAEPRLKVFAILPCLNAWGPPGALAVADVEIAPSGSDETLWVTDAAGSAQAVLSQLAHTDVAGRLVAQAGGLKLFALAGFFQPDDARLSRAPGDLKGVIGAAPTPLDV